MTNRLKVFFLLTAALCLNGQACDETRLHFCYSQYLDSLKISTTPNFPTYDHLKSEIDDLLWALRWHGQIKLCNFQHTLMRCLNHETNDCLDDKHYESALGLHSSDAFQYKTDYFVRKYECTEGLPALANSFDCLIEADSETSQENTYGQCMSSQVHIIQDSTPNCTVANEIIDCTIEFYTHHCGRALKQFSCKVAKIRVQAATDQCDQDLKQC